MNGGVRSALLLLFLCAASAQAAYIDVGTHTLLPNTSDQVVEIILHADPTDGKLISVDFSAFLAPLDRPLEDFLADEPTPSSATGPVFTGLELIGPGMIFFADNTGLNPGGSVALPRFRGETTITNNDGSVVGDGVLARLVIDTTGIFAMPDRDLLYPLTLANYEHAGGTEVIDEFGRFILREGSPQWEVSLGTPYRVTPGHIRIAASPGLQTSAVPEPSSAALAILAGIATICWRRRRSMSKAKP
jgi:hypothetical protein